MDGLIAASLNAPYTSVAGAQTLIKKTKHFNENWQPNQLSTTILWAIIHCCHQTMNEQSLYSSDFPTPVAFIKIFPHTTHRILWLHNNMNSSVLDLCFLFVTLIRTSFSEASSSKHSSASECRPRSTWNTGYCCCSGWHATCSTNITTTCY